MPKKLPRFIYGYFSDEEVSTVFFAGLLGSLVIAIPVIYLLIKQEFFPDANVKTYDSLITSLSFFIAGFIGIVYIIRKEFPLFIVVKGTWAVVIGLAITILAWGISIYALWIAFI